MEGIPFFKKVLISIKDFDKYNILINEKLGRSILYLLEIMLVFAIVVSLFSTYKTDELINQTVQYTKDNIPEFTITEEGLNLDGDNPVIAENPNMIKFKIIFDDEAEEKDKFQEEIDNYNGNMVLLLKNKMVIIIGGRETDKPYQNMLSSEELNTSEISKAGFIKYVEENRMQINTSSFISIFGTTYILYTISTIIDALALSLLVIIISKMAKIALKYSQCITIAISALTLPTLLSLIYSCVNIMTGFYMEDFPIMHTLISYIYIVAVILIMRSDLAKKRQLIRETVEAQKSDQEQDNKETKEEDKNDDEDKEENNEENNEANETEDKKGNKDKGETLGKVKGKIKNKLNEDKDKPEPQANMKE